jgi:hypothetical protein
MAIINYTNVAVSIAGQGTLYANSASYSFSVPIEGVRSLGQKNAIADIPNGPIEGTLNIEYIVTSSDPGYAIFQAVIANPGGHQGTGVSIGGTTFTNAYLTSHSLSAEANAIVNGSLSFTVFGEGGGGMTESVAGTANNINIGHGTASAAISNATSFEYNASIEWEPIYVLNSADSIGVTYRSAQQTLDIRGFNLGRAITKCPENEPNVNVNIGAICGGGNLVNIQIQNGKVASSESSVAAGGYVEGSYQIIKNY